jgi:leader peptidase (prepilin peptidase)/N-methyltransferase
MIALLACVGLVMGILLNLAADSLPTGEHLSLPACRFCGRSRPLYAWSAVVAYLGRRYRCASCGAPLSIRHILVELGSVLLFAFVWMRAGPVAQAVFNALYGSLFILILVIDLEHRLIPHVITLPSIVLALIGAFVNPMFDTPKRALLGGAIGLVGTLVVYWVGGLFARLMGRLRGQPIPEVAFGFGDVTLNTFIGLAVGAPEVIFAMVIGFLVGGIAAISYLVVQGAIKRQYQLFTAIPYGPFLIVGGATMLYFGQEFLEWYIHR